MVVIARSQTERELDELRRLVATLPKLRWQVSKSRNPPWQLDAERLYVLYRQHVDPATGISADGPLVRFIVLTLRRMQRSSTRLVKR